MSSPEPHRPSVRAATHVTLHRLDEALAHKTDHLQKHVVSACRLADHLAE